MADLRLQRIRSLPALDRSPLMRESPGGGSHRVATVAALAFLILGMAGGSTVVWTKPGELHARVIDRDGQPVSGVTVTLRTPERVLDTKISDSKGRVEFVGLNAGDYTLGFEISGFASSSIGPVRLRARPAENPELPEFVVMLNPVRWS
jgi:hypothetical protein